MSNEPTDDIRETMQVALEAAKAATDATQDLNKAKAELQALVGQSRRLQRATMIAMAVVCALFVLGTTLSIGFHSRAASRLEAMVDVNKEALSAFAQHINRVSDAAGQVQTAAAETMAVLDHVLQGQQQTAARVETEADREQVLLVQLEEVARVAPRAAKDALDAISGTLDSTLKRMEEGTKTIEASIASLKNATGGPLESKLDAILRQQTRQAEMITEVRARQDALARQISEKSNEIKFP